MLGVATYRYSPRSLDQEWKSRDLFVEAEHRNEF